MTSAQLDAAFWALLALGSVVAGGLLATAGVWARFYGSAPLSAMLAVGSSAVLLVACSSVQVALMRRHMRFRALAAIGFAGRCVGAGAAVWLALAGFGAWSLVLQLVLSQAVLSLGCIAASGWRPRFKLPLRSLKGVVGFALVETAQQFLGASRSNIFLAAVAFFLPLERVGEIGFAIRFTDALRGVVGAAAGRLCLALFSRQQDAPDRLRSMFLDASRLMGVLALPAFTALAVCAPELIRTVFGERWLGAVFHLQVLSLLSGLLLARLPSAFMYTATARPSVPLCMQLVGISATLLLLVAVSPASPEAVLACLAGPILVALGVEFFVIRAVFGASLTSQLAVLAPGAAMAAALAAAMAGLKALLVPAGLPAEASLVIEAVAGALLLASGLGAMLKRTRLVGPAAL